MPTQFIPFGPLEFDRVSQDASVLQSAINALPSLAGWTAHPGVATSIAADANLATVRGSYLATLSDGTTVLYVGTPTKLFRVSGTSWLDVSRSSGGAYNMPDEAAWSFAQFGNQLVAVQPGDDPQVINLDIGTNFAALGGSPPRAWFCWPRGDFLFLGRLVNDPQKVKWSGLNNIAFWTAGSQSSDEQLFPDGGRIMGVGGPNSEYIFQEQCIRASQFTASDLVFTFDIIDRDRGTIDPYSIVTSGGITFYRSTKGICSLAGGVVSHIGKGRVDVLAETIPAGSPSIRWMAASDERTTLVYFMKNITNAAGALQGLIYDYALDRWAQVLLPSLGAKWLVNGRTNQYTLDTMDSFGPLDTLPASLDSDFWRGGSVSVGFIDTSGALNLFLGSTPLAARFVTSRIEPIAGKVSHFDRMWVSGSEVSLSDAQVSVRPWKDGPVRIASSATENSIGVIDINVAGRLMQVFTGVTWGGSEPRNIAGIYVDYTLDGGR